jgi:hypothetical protein
MDSEKINKEMIERKKLFNRMTKKIRSEANIKDCFHPNKEECIMPIKSAHSLQRQGSLLFLEKEKNGNKYLYIHTERQYNSRYDFFDLKMTGRKTATTFDGFCSFHDTELFKTIENEPEITDINNDKHCFLHSYRSFAISAHRKFEEWKLYNSDDKEIIQFNSKIYSRVQLREVKKGVSAALNDFKKPKELIDNWIMNKEYSKLEYLAFEYPYTIPVGCASYITPHQLPSGKSIQMSPFNKIQSSILTTVLPFSNRSVVILAAFPDDMLGCQFLDELDNIKSEIKQQKFLSFFLFEGSENVVVSPHYIEKKSVLWRKQYCELLNFIADNRTPFLKFNERKFNINYFSPANAVK